MDNLKRGMKQLSRYLPFTAGILLGGFFFWLAVREVDLATSLSLLAEANFWYVAPFAAALVVFYRLKAHRWGRLIEPEQPVAAAKLTPSMMIGFAGNNLLPLRLGELIRVYLASRDLSRSKSFVLATLLVERVFDVVTVMLLLVITMLVIENDSPEFIAARTLLLAGGITLLFVVWAVAFTPQWLSGVGDRLLAWMPARFDARLRPLFGRLRSGFESLRHRRSLLPLFINSVAQWLSLAACIYISIVALNVEAPPIAAVAVLGLLVAGISLPGAPGFIGTIEYCFVAGLGFFDVQSSEALSIAIFYHALSFMFVTMSGAFYLKNYGLSWKALRTKAGEIKSSEA